MNEGRNSDRVSTHFPDVKDFTELLEAAEAKNPGGREGVFVQETRERYTKYGAGMFFSPKQLRWLRKIAGDGDER